MTTKEKIKKAVESMDDYMLEEVYKFINSIKPKQREKEPLPTFKLKGRFDQVDIRDQAYE